MKKESVKLNQGLKPKKKSPEIAVLQRRMKERSQSQQLRAKAAPTVEEDIFSDDFFAQKSPFQKPVKTIPQTVPPVMSTKIPPGKFAQETKNPLRILPRQEPEKEPIPRLSIQPKGLPAMPKLPVNPERILQKVPELKVENPLGILKSQSEKEFKQSLNVENKSGENLVREKKETSSERNIVELYEIVVDGAKVQVSIIRDQMGTTYNVSFPQISPATSTLLGGIRNELIALTTISMKELSDPTSFSTIKTRFMNDARRLLKEKIPSVEKPVEDFLLGTLMQDMMGLGKIEFLIADASLEEIVIPSAKEEIKVYAKKYGWLTTNLKVEKEEDILNYANIIARRVGRQISVLNPLLDAHLITGDRVNAVLYPIDTRGNTITIRKFARDPLTIVDMITSKTCDLEIAALIWMAMEYEMNILISGGTGSGKTSFLNACLPFISPSHRIISIEDTRELMLPEFLYWTPLVTRTPNPEGKGEVSMLDLLINSLRMRPDRIILGEMRKQQEAMVLFEAMHTGHSVYATVHADSAAETISRLVNPPLSVPANLLKSVHLNVVMFRDRKKGIRRVFQVAEFEIDKGGATSNVIYRWVPETDKLIRHSESSRFFEEISRHTGMSNTEIGSEMKEKARILSFMIENSMRSLQEMGKVMNLYYKNKEVLLSAIAKKDKKLILER
jgi:archaeal flagellar protein FlaI